MPSKKLSSILVEIEQRRKKAWKLAELDWMLGQREAAFVKVGAVNQKLRKGATRKLQAAARQYFGKVERHGKISAAAISKRLDVVEVRTAGSRVALDSIASAFDFLASYDRRGFDEAIGELREYAGRRKLRKSK